MPRQDSRFRMEQTEDAQGPTLDFEGIEFAQLVHLICDLAFASAGQQCSSVPIAGSAGIAAGPRASHSAP